MATVEVSVFAYVSEIDSDYGILAELLQRTGSPLPPAELHGGLCGVICAGGLEAAIGWLRELLEDCAGDADTLARLGRRLERLGNETWRALNGPSMEFCPLLPDYQTDISRRAEALGLWCHGFLAGLVVGGVDLGGAAQTLSPELNELVQDFIEISKAGADPDEQQDPDLADGSLVELVQFVRVGAQLTFEELGPESAEQRTIH